MQTKSASRLATTQTTKCRSKVGPEHADRLRARVLWYALRTAVLEGKGAASFRRSDLERMLELPPGAPLDGVLACLPSDAVRVEVGDNRVRLKQPDGDDYVEQVLLHWKAATGRTDRVVFDGKRRGWSAGPSVMGTPLTSSAQPSAQWRPASGTGVTTLTGADTMT